MIDRFYARSYLVGSSTCRMLEKRVLLYVVATLSSVLATPLLPLVVEMQVFLGPEVLVLYQKRPQRRN